MAEDNTMNVLTHILGLLVGFIGPLIMMVASEDENVKKHSKHALNWQFSLLIYLLVGFILTFVIIGIPIIIALGILNIVFPIIAAVKASNGEVWKYPMSIPFFKD